MGQHPERFGIPTDDLSEAASAAAHGGKAVPAAATTGEND